MQFLSFLPNTQTLLLIFMMIGVAAVFYIVVLPMLEARQLNKRLKATASEREKIRARERAKIVETQQKRGSLRYRPQQYMADVVERFSLEKAFLNEETRGQLKMAGFRGESAVVTFLYARFMVPFGAFALCALWMLLIDDYGQDTFNIVLISLGGGILGVFAPVVFVRNQINKRQQSLRRAFPDALDMLLICVESGMSIDAGFKRVSEEIGLSSVPLAEEFMLTSAELSFLQDRRVAFENLAGRTGMEEIRAVVMALQQAEKYGTPLSTSLRVLAQENRDMRMAEAEKKAAALPPKLTVPMILFFVPVLMVVILTPAYIIATSSM